MKVKRAIAMCLTMAALASCVVVPTVIAKPVDYKCTSRGKREFRQNGSSVTSVQGWCVLNVYATNGYRYVDAFISKKTGNPDALRRWNLRSDIYGYSSYVADKTNNQGCEGYLFKW